MQVMTHKPLTIAQQMCLLDHALMRQVDPTELLTAIWRNNMTEEEKAEEVPNLTLFVERFNKESMWIATEVLKMSDLSQRVQVLKRFIEIIKECYDLNNFFSTFALMSGLMLSPVQRLKKTWAALPSATRKVYDEIERVMDPSKNMIRYRDAVLKAKPPMIPFIRTPPLRCVCRPPPLPRSDVAY